MNTPSLPAESWARLRWIQLSLAITLAVAQGASAQHRLDRVYLPEQERLGVCDPARLPPIRPPVQGTPETVAARGQLPQRTLSLNEAIRMALQNAEVIRILGGVTAASSGRTIYDPAIASTNVDTQRARFDPTFSTGASLDHTETGLAVDDLPAVPGGERIAGVNRDATGVNLGVGQTNTLGGQARLDYNSNGGRNTPGGLLNPSHAESLSLSYTHPLLRNAGSDVNLAPIVLARIDTQSSYFRLKDSVQELVRGVIEAYWNLVVARTDVWARRIQVEQGQAAYERAEARKGRFSSAAEVAQTRLALANFRNTLISSQANVLQREAALKNILGFAPDAPFFFVPTTTPTREKISFDWPALLEVAEQQRPDIIELKLVLEADQQRLVLAENEMWPDLNATMLYRWNGLSGETPAAVIRSGSGQLTDWGLSVNFSVPFGLRSGRSGLRRQELTIARDQANLQQGVHAMTHLLALNLRNLDQFFEQYGAVREVREAATENLEQQAAEYRTGRAIFLNVLQAITDWGNSVSSEAQILGQYNIELANLERATGTILDTHGVRFFEERYGTIGPLGWKRPRCYPARVTPGGPADRYPQGDEPAEESFDLEPPGGPRREKATGPDPYFEREKREAEQRGQESEPTSPPRPPTSMTTQATRPIRLPH